MRPPVREVSEAEQSARNAQDFPHGEPQPLLGELGKPEPMPALGDEEIRGSMQHLCACKIDLANERFTSVERDIHTPVPWPEILVLQSIHGEDAIYDIMPVSLGVRDSPAREKQRMTLIYGTDAVEAVYAGRAFQMEWFVPGWPLDPAKAKKRPEQKPRPPRIRKPDDEGALDARS